MKGKTRVFFGGAAGHRAVECPNEGMEKNRKSRAKEESQGRRRPERWNPAAHELEHGLDPESLLWVQKYRPIAQGLPGEDRQASPRNDGR